MLVIYPCLVMRSRKGRKHHKIIIMMSQKEVFEIETDEEDNAKNSLPERAKRN